MKKGDKVKIYADPKGELCGFCKGAERDELQIAYNRAKKEKIVI